MQNSVSADEFEQTIDITAVEVGFVLACENAGQFELLERGQLRECAGIGLGEVAVRAVSASRPETGSAVPARRAS